MTITAFDLAQRFVGLKEVSGPTSNPMILAMLQLDDDWPHDDAVPWCSAFMNYIAWLLRIPRSKSLAARSWLKVGEPIALEIAEKGFDLVVLNRAGGSPDPDVAGPGHVGWFGGVDTSGDVWLLSGNTSDSVTLQRFKRADVLGVRRLAV